MRDIKIKICGISQLENLKTVISCGANYAGFVFFPPSPRSVTIHHAAPLSELAAGRIKRVGLFVNPAIVEIENILKIVPLDMIQLHGLESPELVRQIQKKFFLPVIKAVGIADMADLERSRQYWDHADIMLFDAKANQDDEIPGGLGRLFPHDILNRAAKLPLHWWLSGGIDADNVQEILQRLKVLPETIDVSSSVEVKRGVKSDEKITDFMNIFRTVDSQ